MRKNAGRFTGSLAGNPFDKSQHLRRVNHGITARLPATDLFPIKMSPEIDDEIGTGLSPCHVSYAFNVFYFASISYL